MTTINFAFGFGQCDAMMVEPWGVDMRDDVIAVVDRELCRVQRFDSSGGLLNVWGHYGQAPGEFAQPRDVALGPAGEVYVADTMNNRVQAFAPDGSLLWATSPQGSPSGSFSVPHGITFWFANALLVVADTGNDRIQMLDQQGVLQHQFAIAPPNALNRPTGLAIDADELFIADDRNREVKVAALPGKLARSWGVVPVAPIPWQNNNATDPGPTGMTVLNDRVFVSDLRNSEIHESDRNGTVLATHGGPGRFAGPAGLANDGKRLAVCDSGQHRLILTDFAGYQEEIGSRRSRQNNGCLIEPRHLAVHPGSKQLFVVDGGNRRVQGFTLDGVPTIAFGRTVMRAPFGITVHQDELYITDNSAALPRVYVYDPAGTFIRRINVWFQPGVGPSSATARGIAVDPSGDWLFIADHKNDLVLMVDRTGMCQQFWNFQNLAIQTNTVPSGAYKNAPTDVAIMPGSGTIVIADPRSVSGTVARLWVGQYKAVSNAVATNLSSLGQMEQIAIDEQRSLLYAAANTRIYTVDLNGMTLQQHLGEGGAPGQLRGATGVALTPDGRRLYVSEWQNHRVQAFDITP